MSKFPQAEAPSAGQTGKSHIQYIKVMNEHQPVSQFRTISPQQLQQHGSAHSAWLSYKGVVYDATVYLKYHPGGAKLLEGCGGQADQLVQKYHSWVNVEYLLGKYKLGYLGDSQ